MTMKPITLSILIAALLIGGAILLVRTPGPSTDSLPAETADNVRVVDGVQRISISAKGGYSPRITNAAAGVPTVIEMDTRGTFDCSSSLVIPSISYRNTLPPSGETVIEIPPQEPGTSMQGLCAMGMYNFTINFN